MLSASLYITACSARNRFRQRMKRLREPRYLLGAVVGAVYLYFTFFTQMRASRRTARRRAVVESPAAALWLGAAGPALGGVALLALAAASWLMPRTGGLLEFSRSEVQFLFPAPVTRRQLLIHRIVRSQLGLFFASFIPALFFPAESAGRRVRLAVAVFVALMTVRVYFAGVILARTRLASHDPKVWRVVAWMPLGMMIVAVAVVAGAIGLVFAGAPVASAADALNRLHTATTTGIAALVLWPTTALARPFFVTEPSTFMTAILGAAAVLSATIIWVLTSDAAAFEKATAEAAERRDRQPTQAVMQYTVREPAWTLGVTGRSENVFLWKGAVQTLRVIDPRTLARFAAVALALAILAVSIDGAGGLAELLGLVSITSAGAAVLFGPQILRLDLRQDLAHLELLKTWPVRPASVVRGELLWPAFVVSSVAWVLIALALFFSTAVFSSASVGWRVSLAVSAGLVAPALILAQYTIHNAAALVFPAWVAIGSGRPHGVEAMGQRLILLAGTSLGLLVMTLPGGVVGALVSLALYPFTGPFALVPGAAACACVIAMEVFLAIEALGPVYDRVDLTEVDSR